MQGTKAGAETNATGCSAGDLLSHPGVSFISSVGFWGQYKSLENPVHGEDFVKETSYMKQSDLYRIT